MKTQYATMVGSICLDKFIDGDGVPAPVTFDVKQVQDGHQAWQNQAGTFTRRHNYSDLEGAVKALFGVFELEMSERNMEFKENGVGEWTNDGPNLSLVQGEPWQGETGWYGQYNDTLTADYATCFYPQTWEEWVEKQIHAYSYDNYTVCIVTSNGDLVY